MNSSGVTIARSVIQMNLSGEFIAEFASVKLASKQFGGKLSDQVNIARVCRLNVKQKTAYGYKWKFKETEEKE